MRTTWTDATLIPVRTQHPVVSNLAQAFAPIHTTLESGLGGKALVIGDSISFRNDSWQEHFRYRMIQRYGWGGNGDSIACISYIFAGDPRSDVNGDGINDNGDIGAFVAAFLAGC